MKYKMLDNTPRIKDMSNIKIVTIEEFLEFDDLTPLLVCNQYQFYPEEFKDLKLLKDRKIALVGMTYLSGIETNIEEYFLDNYTIGELVSSSVIYREYYENDRYTFKIKNYWQPWL